VPSGTPICYPVLDQNSRFKDGLGKIGKSIVERLSSPRIVTVAGQSRELNATNAESIIATIISEANKGKIDLGGFDTFWTYTKNDIRVTLREVSDQLAPVAGSCSETACTGCVCSFKNSVVASGLDRVSQALGIAKAQAKTMFNVDLDKYIAQFQQDTIQPWQEQNSCSGADNTISPKDSELCDVAQIPLGSAPTAKMSCNMLFLCGSPSIDGASASITTDSLWIGQGTSISNKPLPKGAKGQDATAPGASGLNGGNGKNAPNIQISADKLMPTSGNSLQYISKGGDGGDGGNGMKGQDNMANYPTAEMNSIIAQGAAYVVSHGSLVSHDHHDTGTHCGGHCHTQEDYWHYKLDVVTTAGCGGNGGNGGKGGNAGSAGLLTVTGSAGVTASNQRQPSQGGSGGVKGVGVYGKRVDAHFTAWHHKWETPGCHGFLGLECGPSYPEANGGYTHTGENGVACPGKDGTDGAHGQPWSV